MRCYLPNLGKMLELLVPNNKVFLKGVAEAAHHARGYGAGRTVWDMRRRFGVDLSKVTWEMLEKVDHFPMVLIRRRPTTSP